MPTKLFSSCFNCGYKIMRRNGQKLLLKIALFSVVSVFIYMFMVKAHKSLSTPTPRHRLLLPALSLIHKESDIHPEDLGHYGEVSLLELHKEFQTFKIYQRELASLCTNKSQNDACENEDRLKGKSLLTLFTTWTYDEHKFSVHNTTLYNLKALPGINVIVFSNCSKVKYYSEKAGWKVLPVLKEAASAPILPAMFHQAKTSFTSVFYCYVNGDILFTDQLLKTLRTVACDSSIKDKVIIIGKRTNILASKIPKDVVLPWHDVERLAVEHGSIFQADAEDYFITDSHFPWEEFPPMPIGRRGYDNWVVAFARYRNYTLIDATDSMLALHLTLAERGNYEGLHKQHDNNYNIDLVRSMNAPFHYGLWGKTHCAGWRTWINLCDRVMLKPRQTINPECSAMKGLLARFLGQD